MRDALADGPNYYAPTVLTGATRAMEVSCAEIFGPVVPVFRFDSETEVVASSCSAVPDCDPLQTPA